MVLNGWNSKWMEFLSLSVWSLALSLCCLSESTKVVDWVSSSVYTPFKEDISTFTQCACVYKHVCLHEAN